MATMKTLSERIAEDVLHLSQVLHGATRNRAPDRWESMALVDSNPEPAASRTLIESFVLKDRLDGHVTEVVGGSFYAGISSPTRPGIREEVRFTLAEVEETQRDFVKPGALFHWNQGYIKTAGLRAQTAFLEFRPPEFWSAQEMKDIKRKAEKLDVLFKRGPKGTAA